jgi:hypothetical protein
MSPTSRVAHRSTKVLTILPSYTVRGDCACRGFSADRAIWGAGLSLVGLGTVASSDPSAGVNSG